MSGPLLDRAAMLAAFALLDHHLVRCGITAQISVVGGAAMTLAWDSRRATRDVDGIFETDRHAELIREIHAVADELGLPRSWLNEQATMYAPRDYRSATGTVYDGKALTVTAASAEAVLAMKVRAARPSDIGDITFLLEHLSLHSVDEVLGVHDRYFPGDALPDRNRQVLDDLLLPHDPTDD